MKTACVQFQPGLAGQSQESVRAALRNALPDAELTSGNHAGPYENLCFPVTSSQDALVRLATVLNDANLGHAARASCILTCEGNLGWDDYTLLHHYDPAESR